jgi:hypothetical protein
MKSLLRILLAVTLLASTAFAQTKIPLTNLSQGGASDEQILAFDTATGVWRPIAQPASGGTVTSVGLQVFTGLAVTPGTITGADTFVLSTTLSGPLRGTGTGFAVGNLNLGSEVSGDLALANFTQGSALSILGVAGNATADFASIAAASDGQVLRRSGTTLGFGQLNLASANAVTGALPIGNISATGTPNSGNFLRGDGQWATPAGAGDMAKATYDINLDDDIDDAAIASTIARDSEVTAALASYQPLDSDLTSIAALTTTAAGRALLDDANTAALQATLALTPGTNVQAYDADLADLADGSLTGSLVGSGIPAGNITTGTLPDARLASTVTLDADFNDQSEQDTLGMVTKTGTQTITGTKTLQNTDYNIVAHGAAGATETVDVSAGATHTVTLDANLTLSFTNFPAGKDKTVAVDFVQNGTGGWTVTVGASPVFVETTASVATTVLFRSKDGGTTIEALGPTLFDSAIANADDGRTTLSPSRDDVRDYVAQNDSDFDGLPSAVEDDAVGIAGLSATGTASGSTYLRGDNTWATIAGGGDMLKATYDANTDDDIDDAAIASTIARDSEVAAAYQPLDSDLTALAALSTTPAGRGILDDADATAMRATIGAVIGTNVQAYDADLTTWAGVTPGTGVATALAVATNAAGGVVLTDGTAVLTNKSLTFSASLGTDDTFTGNIIAGLNNTGGVTQWNVVSINSSSQWLHADADAASTRAFGVAVSTATTGNAVSVLTQGTIRNDAWAWTVGGAIYLSTDPSTTSGMTQTAPTGVSDVVQLIGYALTADIIYVNISGEYLEVAP